MELNNKQIEFITLRADGLSFDKIAKQLKISKATLIQWSKLFEDNIKEFKSASKMAKQLSSKGGMKGLHNMLSQVGANGMPKIPR